MIKKSTVLLMSLCALGLSHGAVASVSKLTKFSDLSASLEKGNIVRAVIDFNNCNIETNIKQERRSPLGGISFTAFMKYETDVNGKKANVLATTDSILVHSEKFGLVYDRISLHVLDNGNVEFVSELVDPKNYNVVGETSYACHFANDNEKNSVSFFEIS